MWWAVDFYRDEMRKAGPDSSPRMLRPFCRTFKDEKWWPQPMKLSINLSVDI